MSEEDPAYSSNRGTSQCGCEWNTEGDTERIDDATAGSSSVLWEKRFQQTICIDITDDDKLHVSHLQSSITVRVSQASAASSDDSESSGSYSDEGESSSLSCINSEQKHHNNIKDTKESEMKVLFTQPSKLPKQMECRNQDDNTSDEDQEELPYDDDRHHVKQNSKTLYIADMKCGQGSDMLNSLSKDALKINEGLQEHDKASAPLPSFLLRHFSQDDLLNCSKLIEAETMPEVSLLESLDETIRSRALPYPHIIPESHRIEVKTSRSRADSSTGPAESGTVRNNRTDKVLNESVVHNLSDFSEGSRFEYILNGSSSPVAVKDNVEENVKPSCSSSTPNLYKADDQNVKCSLARTRSCSELKYGQGQVHYRLPDFSKVAPKVKIPKCNGVNKSGCNSAVDKVHTQPGIPSKTLSSCKVDVINRVLEDSVWLSTKPNLLRDEARSRLDQELKAEYDRILAKCADMEPMDEFQASSEPSLVIHWEETADILDIQHSIDQIRPVPQTCQSAEEGLNEEKRDANQQNLTEGQRLTTELKDIIYQYNMKVEEFKMWVYNNSIPVEEQQVMFKCMMEAQDQLERNYINKKEEHRVLEMQSYMGINSNTGEFDPDRQVEGEIFRMGMHLEDIKEQIDRNACHKLSPPPSSATPTLSLHEGIISPSLQPPLQKESRFSSSNSNHSMGKEEEYFKTSKEPRPAESPQSCRMESSFQPCQMSWITRQDEEGGVSMTEEEEDSKDVLAQLTSPGSPNPQRIPSRPRDTESHIPESSQHYTNTTKVFVSPEADNSFGTADWSRPVIGPPFSQSITESSSPSDVSSLSRISMTDSNLHTAVYTAACTEQDQPPYNVQNMQWTCTTQTTPIRLDIKGQLPLDGATLPVDEQHEAGQSLPSSLIQRRSSGKTLTRDTHLHCTCQNSEAIRALQYEVSHLKKVLEKTLGPLAHLSNRNTQEKRLRARPSSRNQHRSASTRGQNTHCSAMEDWISSDIESSKSKDSGESDHTEISLRAPHKSIHTQCKNPSNRRSHDLKYSSPASLENLSLVMSQSKQSNNFRRASKELTFRSSSVGTSASNGPMNHNIRHSTRPISPGNTSNTSLGQTCHRNAVSRSTGSLTSCCSLPSGFKVQDAQSEPEVVCRRRSTQSDSALLPSNIYFQWTSSLPTSPHRTRERAQRHRVNKEEAINRTLDKALEAVLLMKQSTDRMAKTLSADLAKAQLYRKLHGLHHLSDREKP